jgi:hypothetical protein
MSSASQRPTFTYSVTASHESGGRDDDEYLTVRVTPRVVGHDATIEIVYKYHSHSYECQWSHTKETTAGKYEVHGDVLVLASKTSCQEQEETREKGGRTSSWSGLSVVSTTTQDVEPSFRAFRVVGVLGKPGSTLQVVPVYPVRHLRLAGGDALHLEV